MKKPKLAKKAQESRSPTPSPDPESESESVSEMPPPPPLLRLAVAAIKVQEEEEPPSQDPAPDLDIDMDTSPSHSLVPPRASVSSSSMPPPSSTCTSTKSSSSSPHTHSLSPQPPTPTELTNGTAPTPPPPTPATSTTPSPLKPSAASKKLPPPSPQIIGHLPIARTEAIATFTQIPDNQYQYGTLGRSREALESMTCDCTYDHGVDNPTDACGHGSDCINRLTQVECLSDDCRCRAYCQNQRFQNKEYASIEIVQTEKKGFGLRAETDLRKDSFIYEYVGEVVNQPSFKKRMRDYAAEGIRHFYFMMLQKDEFIDATKRGGIGRFANHSCNPNCYVAKWTIGHHVRMGIFANRNIKQHEELTFNYNVDRYGHEAQPCYCGEPKCVGFIGGKTQTDIATMDDLYLDALGITDEADRMALKGSKKKRGKKIDDPDFMPILKPIVEKDVPKVVQAMRQTQSRKVLFKLLTRIKITEDQAALRQIMRLRGFSLMTNTLEDHAKDLELIALALDCMFSWPLMQRNKVEDSKVIVPVEAWAASEHEQVKALAQKLLDHWDTLPLAYRIPKRMKQDGEEEETTTISGPTYEDEDTEPRPQKRSRYEEAQLEIRPLGFSASSAPLPTPQKNETSPARRALLARSKSRVEAAALIAAVAAEREAAEAAALAAAAAAKLEATPAPEENGVRKKHKSPKKHQTPEEKEANKEKRLLKLVGAVVVKCMSKHSKAMDHDLFKKHAKELTQLIADKEKKSSTYKEAKLDSLSDEKVVKIKKFAKEYIAKVLRKLEKSGQRRRTSSTLTPQGTSSSTLLDTPNSADGSADVVMAGVLADESVNMDAESQSEGEEEVHANGQDDRERGSPPSEPMELGTSSPAHLPVWPTDGVTESWGSVGHTKHASDPRRRPPSLEDEVCGWEPHKRFEEWRA